MNVYAFPGMGKSFLSTQVAYSHLIFVDTDVYGTVFGYKTHEEQIRYLTSMMKSLRKIEPNFILITNMQLELEFDFVFLPADPVAHFERLRKRDHREGEKGFWTLENVKQYVSDAEFFFKDKFPITYVQPEFYISQSKALKTALKELQHV